MFKLNRILNYEILNEGFQLRLFPKQKEISLKMYNQITLRFPKEMAYRVYDEFDVTQITYQENGDLIASANMPEDSWLISFLLSFGTKVEIIEPVYLREILKEQAQLIYKKYKT